MYVLEAHLVKVPSYYLYLHPEIGPNPNFGQKSFFMQKCRRHTTVKGLRKQQ